MLEHDRSPNKMAVNPDLAREVMITDVPPGKLKGLYMAYSFSNLRDRVVNDSGRRTFPATLAMYPETVDSPSVSCLYTVKTSSSQVILTSIPR